MLADGLGLSTADRDAFLLSARSLNRPGRRRTAYPPLPRASGSLLGRSEELHAIELALAGNGARLLTVTGPGGVGKTRLAIEIAPRLAARFPDGIVFVRLDGLTDPNLVLPTLAAAMQLVETGGAELLLDQLGAFLATRDILIIFDNLEHLLDAAPRIADLLSRAPRTRILVTSRESLRVTGEQVFRVAPLPRPEPALWRSPDSLLDRERSPAVNLFLERAGAVRPDLELHPHDDDGQRNLAAIAEICHHLDGLPLAIELAAAQVQVLTPAAILALLKTYGLPLLTAGDRDQPSRLQTMDAAIDWSYGLLSPADQSLFRALSVFAGGFSLPAVGWIGGEEQNIASRIASLARRNLILEDLATPGHAAPRFRMLEPIRLFALDRLRAQGEEDQARRRHAIYFADLAQTLDARTLGPDPEIWLTLQALDLDNFRAAMDWAFAADESDLAGHLTAYVAGFWIIKGMLAEGRQRLAAAIAVDSALAAAVRWYLRFWAGNFALDAGDASSGKAYAREMSPIAEAADDRVGVGAGLTLLSRALGMSVDGHEDAAALALRAVEMLEPLGKGEWTGWAWSRLGIESQHLGRLDEARDCLQRSLEIRRDMRCEACVSYSLALLGGTLLNLGQPEAARDAYRECLELTVKHDNPTLMLPALIGLADVVWRVGAGEDAVRLSLQIMGTAEALRQRHGLTQSDEARQTIARWQSVVCDAIGDAAVDEAFVTGMDTPPAAIAGLVRHLEVTTTPLRSGPRAAVPSLAAAIGNID
jgi:predicted ATPase